MLEYSRAVPKDSKHGRVLHRTQSLHPAINPASSRVSRVVKGVKNGNAIVLRAHTGAATRPVSNLFRRILSLANYLFVAPAIFRRRLTTVGSAVRRPQPGMSVDEKRSAGSTKVRLDAEKPVIMAMSYRAVSERERGRTDVSGVFRLFSLSAQNGGARAVGRRKIASHPHFGMNINTVYLRPDATQWTMSLLNICIARRITIG